MSDDNRDSTHSAASGDVEAQQVEFSNRGDLEHAEDEPLLIPDSPAELSAGDRETATKKQKTSGKNSATCSFDKKVMGGIIICLTVTLIAVLATRGHKGSSNIDPNRVTAAARLLDSIDASADPCTDFYQYACGKWEMLHEIPEDSASVTSFSLLYEENLLRVRRLLDNSTSHPEFKSPQYFRACMDEKLRDEESKAAFQAVLNEFQAATTIEDRMAALMMQDVSAFLSLGVGADDRNASINNLFLSQDGLGLPDRDYYLNKTIATDPILTAYATYISNTLALLGLPEQGKDVVGVEMKLAEISIPNDELKDPEALYNPYTIDQLNGAFAFLNWKAFLQTIYPQRTPQSLIVSTPAYFQRLSAAWTAVGEEDRSAYLLWRLVSRFASVMGSDIRAERQKLLQAVYGTASAPPLWRTCVSSTDSALGFELGRMFVDEYFSESAKEETNQMVEVIRTAFLDRLHSVKWMDKETRRAAQDKATAVQQKIGYPEFIKDNKKLQEHYQNVTVGDLHLSNYRSVLQWEIRRNFNDLFKPVDRSRWSMTPATVNAYYSPSYNEIVFPAGILQIPFFSTAQEISLTFGGLGVVIGHELSHGFDDQGRQYDKSGDLHQWWSNETIRNFKERAQCFVDQYDQYEVNGDHVNGKLTLGENIADNGGLHTAYAAFKLWTRWKQKAKRLPGLKLSPKQLFFIGFAQVWCSKFRPEEAHNRILTDVHSPAKYRVIGAVSNSEDFNKAFSCPTQEREMCRLW